MALLTAPCILFGSNEIGFSKPAITLSTRASALEAYPIDKGVPTLRPLSSASFNISAALFITFSDTSSAITNSSNVLSIASCSLKCFPF